MAKQQIANRFFSRQESAKYFMANGEEGFVLVLSLVFLVIISLMAIAGIRMSSTELKIAGNERVAKVNYYEAEGAAYEGVQRNLNKYKPEDLLPNSSKFTKDPAIGDLRDISTVRPAGNYDKEDDMALLDQNADGVIDFTIDGDSTTNTALEDGVGLFEGEMKLMVILNDISSGNSLGIGASRLYDFSSYGYSAQKNSNALITVGFKKRF